MTEESRGGGRGRSRRLWRLLGLAEDPPPEPAPGAEPPEGPRMRIRECREGPAGRPVVTVSGRLRAVSERTVGGLPALEAELDDGSGILEVVWLGRRAIAGIEPGRSLTASGRFSVSQGRPVLFNPRYELRPLGTE
ncbi:OB-fold nucleic acid binding domain-containing protein [Streptomyces sp. YIM 98790]|uniref:OB-fold nucleic acid binding domain-containing protein n=1 Tax=Streptomyces sp. YIM 98790 TaxID=2689077 RepID=UPI00140AEF32|nr:OB-fold nucleic acid binding domain-containing protein [Streptomyces sp. YIM 98790]